MNEIGKEPSSSLSKLPEESELNCDARERARGTRNDQIKRTNKFWHSPCRGSRLKPWGPTQAAVLVLLVLELVRSTGVVVVVVIM
jgi:hypothetical protein